jgi:hypothetical protein
MRGFWVRQKGTGRRYQYLVNSWKYERKPIMKEGDIFESLLDGTEYVVKNIVNKMVVLQSTKENRQILTGVETLKTNSLYREKEKKTRRCCWIGLAEQNGEP